MGREIKRVAAGFEWPLGEVWSGYEEWTDCEICEGEGEVEGVKCAACEGRGGKDGGDPPSGDWWQLWETTSEGSPVSPAFATPELLAVWLSTRRRSARERFNQPDLSYQDWLLFITECASAPAFYNDSKEGLLDGVTATVRAKKAVTEFRR